MSLGNIHKILYSLARIYFPVARIPFDGYQMIYVSGITTELVFWGKQYIYVCPVEI